nr:MAG TPA: hypothetical protein [Caudoviricetes sp.]
MPPPLPMAASPHFLIGAKYDRQQHRNAGVHRHRARLAHPQPRLRRPQMAGPHRPARTRRVRGHGRPRMGLASRGRDSHHAQRARHPRRHAHRRQRHQTTPRRVTTHSSAPSGIADSSTELGLRPDGAGFCVLRGAV